MMNKLLTKTIGKWKLWTIITAIVLALGLILGCVFGANLTPTSDSTKNLVVHLESRATESVVEKIEYICQDAIGDLGLNTEYEYKGEIAGGLETDFIYVFNKGVSEKKMAQLETAVEDAIAAEREEAESVLKTVLVYVKVEDAQVSANLSKGYIWRAVLTGVVAILFVFIYSTIRHKWHLGGAVTLAALLTGLLQTALVMACRIPVEGSYAGVFVVGIVLGAVLANAFACAVKAAFKAEENAGKSVQEIVLAAIPCKEILLAGAALLAATILMGAIAVSVVCWAMLAAIVGVISALFVSLILLPAVYVPVREKVNAVMANRARYDYKKGGKKKAEQAEEAQSETIEE
jgi:hypothetical protein